MNPKENPFKIKESLPHFEQLKNKLENPKYLPMEQEIIDVIIEAGEQKIGNCFQELCDNKEKPIYEFFNQEFINSFSDYLTKRINVLKGDKEFVSILEVGAGNGKLSYFLSQNQKLKNLPVKIIPTDNNTWNIKTDFNVENIGHQEALEKYDPDIVIFCWMPLEEDYTEDFRKHSSVKEYILIGESGGGCCGDEWKTWGLSYMYDESFHGNEVPPYKKDGFEISDDEELGNVSKKQLSRGDYYNWKNEDGTDSISRHSVTVSFRRL